MWQWIILYYGQKWVHWGHTASHTRTPIQELFGASMYEWLHRIEYTDLSVLHRIHRRYYTNMASINGHYIDPMVWWSQNTGQATAVREIRQGLEVLLVRSSAEFSWPSNQLLVDMIWEKSTYGFGKKSVSFCHSECWTAPTSLIEWFVSLSKENSKVPKLCYN